MRRLALTTALALLAAAPVAARVRSHIKTIPGPDPCTQQADTDAFDVIGLKSELTVTALACHEQDRYNSFMRAYQPAVVSAEHDMTGYFKRVYGKRYQSQHDEYITNLAAAQEQEGLKDGTAFCAAFANMFDEVMSLHDATELADYARSQALVQPVVFAHCSAVPVAPASKVKVTHRRVRKT